MTRYALPSDFSCRAEKLHYLVPAFPLSDLGPATLLGTITVPCEWRTFHAAAATETIVSLVKLDALS